MELFKHARFFLLLSESIGNREEKVAVTSEEVTDGASLVYSNVSLSIVCQHETALMSDHLAVTLLTNCSIIMQINLGSNLYTILSLKTGQTMKTSVVLSDFFAS